MLFLSGGDTADAVLTAVHAKGLLLRKEILPGVPCGELIGTRMEGLPVVTKAGAFGDRETLVALHECWSKGARREQSGRSA
jgi:uncharacterized protein YgbK (DUF1537 family)